MKTHCIGVLIVAASLAAWLLAACADASGKEPPPLVLRGHSDMVASVAFSPDGKRVLTGSADKTARLWNAVTGQEIRAFGGDLQPVLAVAFSPDGKRILTGSIDGTARLWGTETGKEVRAFQAGDSNFMAKSVSVAFSPDGKYVLTACMNKTPRARVWDAETGREIRAFRDDSEDVLSVTFSPDGKRVLTGSMDGPARLWNAETGKEIGTFRAPFDMSTMAFRAVVFSPDGKRIVGCGDKTARLWDVETDK